jgi:hypothetical protein
MDRHPDPVKTIGNVDFEELHWSKPWIGPNDLSDESFKGATELHCFGRCEADGLLVDARKGVVHDRSRATFMLGNDAHG